MRIQFDRVNFSYVPNRPVLQNFSLRLPENGTVCLTGPSGCGKTTLLRLLAGLEHPQAGTVYTSPHTALLFQESRLLPWATAQENVAAVLQTNRAQALEEAARWLLALGLGDFLSALPRELSGGMQQRVSLARALAFAPELLLMDEPFHALDAQTRRQCASVLRRYGTQQLTVLVTHDREEARLLADSTVSLQGPPLQVCGTAFPGE